MGLLDKLFGGAKKPETDTPPAPAATPAAPAGPAAPAAEGASAAIPPRRERSKPQPADANTSNEPPEILPTDGENAELLAAINGIIQSDNVETRRVLYDALLKSQLLLVSMGGEELGEGEVQLQQGQQLQLATIKGPDGKTYLPAFTDLPRLSVTVQEKARYLRISATAVCQMFLQGGGEGIVINPSQPPSGLITRPEAEILATGNAPELDENGALRTTAQQQMRISIGRPSAIPADSFIEAIRDTAGQHPSVREVHVFSAGIEDQAPRLMIGVLLDEGLTPEEMHPTFEAIGKAAYEQRGDTEQFDMMPLNDQMVEAVRSLEGLVYSRA